MTNLELIYTGSVKNIYRVKDIESSLYFEFSDRYSIYDWGEMPDAIEGKGLALASITDVVFKSLESYKNWKSLEFSENFKKDFVARLTRTDEFLKLTKEGLLSHRSMENSLVKEDGRALWQVKKIHVPKIENQNYEVYQTKPINTLVPLEVVFRFGTPKGASILKRFQKDHQYMFSLGIEQMPREGEWLSSPIIEFSTKLEKGDRYLSYFEAKRVAGLNEKEFLKLYNTALSTACFLYNKFKAIGLDMWDGKLEFAFIESKEGPENRDFMLVDSIGIDELRLTYQGAHFSKEILRQYYWKSSWYKSLEKYKDKYQEWKEVMEQRRINPDPLDYVSKKSIEQMYAVLAEVISSYFLSGEVKTDLLKKMVLDLKKNVLEKK